MIVTYYFDNEPYDYETEEGLTAFIEEVIPFDEQVNIYLNEVYDKDADERDLMYQDFGLKSRTEVNDYLWSEGGDWLPEALSDNAEDYIKDNYMYEIEDYYREDAFEEFNEPSMSDIHDEWEKDYWRSRT